MGGQGKLNNKKNAGDGATSFIDSARGVVIAVIGDLMLDEWIIGSTSRISPEAPVPVVRFSERSTAPGGAANVAMNLLSLGAKVRVCGLIGKDEAGSDLARSLKEAGADIGGLVRDAGRPTTLKTRIVAQSQQQRQQMVRVDREWDGTMTPEVGARMRAAWEKVLAGAQVLCISDYDKGFAAGSGIEEVIKLAREAKMRITGGPKPHNLPRFCGAHYLSLNQKETSEAAALKLDSEERVLEAGELLQKRTHCEALAITRSEHGVMLFQHDTAPRHIIGHAVEVFDGTGAGDTFLAASTIAIAGGAGYAQAAELGNLAAAASVRHAGVVAVTPDDVRNVARE